MAPPCRAPTSPAPRSASVGRSLAWRPPWSADFQLILLRVRLCLWLADGCACLSADRGIRQPQRPKSTLFIRTVCPLFRLQQVRNSSEGGRQSLSRTTLESQQKGKFWVGAKFAFLHTKSTKINKIFNGNKKQKFTLFLSRFVLKYG